jgi:hypothetical protein
MLKSMVDIGLTVIAAGTVAAKKGSTFLRKSFKNRG